MVYNPTSPGVATEYLHFNVSLTIHKYFFGRDLWFRLFYIIIFPYQQLLPTSPEFYYRTCRRNAKEKQIECNTMITEYLSLNRPFSVNCEGHAGVTKTREEVISFSCSLTFPLPLKIVAWQLVRWELAVIVVRWQQATTSISDGKFTFLQLLDSAFKYPI